MQRLNVLKNVHTDFQGIQLWQSIRLWCEWLTVISPLSLTKYFELSKCSHTLKIETADHEIIIGMLWYIWYWLLFRRRTHWQTSIDYNLSAYVGMVRQITSNSNSIYSGIQFMCNFDYRSYETSLKSSSSCGGEEAIQQLINFLT